MVGIVTNAVLVAQLRSNLIQNIFDLVTASFSPVTGEQPCSSAARISKGVQDIHVNGVATGRISAALFDQVLRERPSWYRQRNRKRNARNGKTYARSGSTSSSRVAAAPAWSCRNR